MTKKGCANPNCEAFNPNATGEQSGFERCERCGYIVRFIPKEKP